MSNKKENIACIILAAGKGKRMHSTLPKVLHRVCGRPMLGYALDTIRAIKNIKKKIVVAGYGYNLVKEFLSSEKDIKCVKQRKLLGTADAVKACKKYIPSHIKHVLVLYADSPLLTSATLNHLINLHIKNNAGATLLTANLKDPAGYGRIIRDNLSNVIRISEEKELTYHEKDITEIYVGVSYFDRSLLFRHVEKIKPNNKSKEYYLTDIVQTIFESGVKVEALEADDLQETQGVNSKEDLQMVNEIMRRRITQNYIAKGVNIIDPQSTFINGDVIIGENSVIYPFTIIESNVKIGSNCKVGPFCHLRPGTIIEDEAEVGNFLEIVRSRIQKGTKAKHFGYLGDSNIGKLVNIGAGTVTANYDGKQKNTTKIKDKAFIGSDTVLVAPVSIGKSAVTGAGSIVIKNTVVSDKATIAGIPAKVLKPSKSKLKSKK